MLPTNCVPYVVNPQLYPILGHSGHIARGGEEVEDTLIEPLPDVETKLSSNVPILVEIQ